LNFVRWNRKRVWWCAADIQNFPFFTSCVTPCPHVISFSLNSLLKTN
jgi:hypothetical protein